MDQEQSAQDDKMHAVIDDIIGVFIDHDLTIKEAKDLISDQATFSRMMHRVFCSPPLHPIKKDELYHGLILFLRENYPGCSKFIYERQNNSERTAPDQTIPQRMYDEYISWAKDHGLLAYNRYRFYEVLSAMGLRRRTVPDSALVGGAQGPSGSV